MTFTTNHAKTLMDPTQLSISASVMTSVLFNKINVTKRNTLCVCEGVDRQRDRDGEIEAETDIYNERVIQRQRHRERKGERG